MSQEISYESAVSKEFRKKFSKRSVRPASLDDLKILAKKFFLREELPASCRASAMVVFIYKCIETNDFDSLAEIDPLYEQILLV